MLRKSLHWLAASLVLLVGVAAAAQPPRPPQQPQQSSREISYFGRRYDGFRQLFQLKGLTLGSKADFDREAATENASKWVVVALGRLDAVRVPAEYLPNGGSLLAATDSGSDAFNWLGVRFAAGEVLDPTAPIAADCPLTGGVSRNDPLFRGVARVAFNRAGYLELQQGLPTRMLAWFGDEVRVDGQPRHLLTAIARSDAERALFVADQSVFINEMFLGTDKKPFNARFCANVVDWLVNGRDPAEVRVLFLEDGEPISEWIDPRYLEGRWPQNRFEENLDFYDELMKAAEKYVGDLQRRRDPETGLMLFDQWIRNLESRLWPGTYIRWGILAASMLLAFAVARWMLQWSPTRIRTPKQETPPIAAKPHFLERRRREMLEGGHYVELARRMSRMWLEQRYGETFAAGNPPEPELRGGYFKRRAAQRTWRRLWDLATGKPADSMSYREFERFRAEMDQLTRSLPRKRGDAAEVNGSRPPAAANRPALGT